ncbi:MAG: molybdopterin synthase sulfur carrier subunit [Hydrogenophilales bacterium CG03_land_8_20_14_0_80_62_28]|nr:molybdopterin synthase sulfur carrier subunit [Betaproteobacteria bacterium]OIO76743.1 MAG: hypothetical protein AUJ86_11115 [Hydrogenophilaceae bacterium CG1_02_62_390]PIV23537.1 MAG: molybdopterin synthase sulfur carrier subunit [Hydrogenophilales bacterium CG03_land_8_20_14_0_80_62_28]PIW38388.1 MAG: molybdopterin synthase sulfur carrier subunit [Hydrogenophilales bacterium CG15_BIG_FIL_POST_REV_8_21_14_020_62_31]PIW71741.1 MAG: molybdopterin synthase sulfur carrier subunit [Hydrogenophil
MNPITVLYFGDLMARLQIGRESLRLPMSVKDVAGLMKLLAMRGGDWRAAFSQARATLRVTVNKQDAGFDAALQGGDEVAFIESVSI